MSRTYISFKKRKVTILLLPFSSNNTVKRSRALWVVCNYILRKHASFFYYYLIPMQWESLNLKSHEKGCGQFEQKKKKISKCTQNLGEMINSAWLVKKTSGISFNAIRWNIWTHGWGSSPTDVIRLSVVYSRWKDGDSQPERQCPRYDASNQWGIHLNSIQLLKIVKYEDIVNVLYLVLWDNISRGENQVSCGEILNFTSENLIEKYDMNINLFGDN